MTDTLFKILECLKGFGFVSGEKIGEKLSISRAAVSKGIARLKECGYVINSVNKIGHKLSEPLPYNEMTLKLLLPIDVELSFFNTVKSTMQEASGATVSGKFFAVVSQEQTAGRGRLERSFSSKTGGMYVSFVVQRPKIDVTNLTNLVLLCGVCLIDTLKLYNVEAKLKWPNDVVLNEKKLSGMICSSSIGFDGVEKVIFGVGVNFYNDIKDMEDIVTSLASYNISISSFTAKFIESLRDGVCYAEENGFEEILNKYRNYSCTIGNNVLVIGENSFEGLACGVDDFGMLLVKRQNEIVTVKYGDVSVRNKPKN